MREQDAWRHLVGLTKYVVRLFCAFAKWPRETTHGSNLLPKRLFLSRNYLGFYQFTACSSLPSLMMLRQLDHEYELPQMFGCDPPIEAFEWVDWWMG